MQLHYRLRGQSLVPGATIGPTARPTPRKTTIVLLHGLFGSLDNLGCLARNLQRDHTILSIDLRNHGLSPHHSDMNYQVMAQDVQQVLQQLSLQQVMVIGHSMGGKVAMALALLAPEYIRQLLVLDIAPVSYPDNRHQDLFKALQAVKTANILERRAAARLLREQLIEERILQFLLKSFYHGAWRFNLPVLQQNYPVISRWSIPGVWHGPSCFIGGQCSDYLQPEYHQAVRRQFPHAVIHTIPAASHWLHAEQTTQVLRILRQFIVDSAMINPCQKVCHDRPSLSIPIPIPIKG